MKQIFFLQLLFLAFFACKPATPSDTQSEDNKPRHEIDTLANPISTSRVDSSVIPTDDPSVSVPDPVDQTPLVKPKPKICNPNFTKLSSPAKTHHIYYISNFTVGEFKCWTDLEEEALKICNGNLCVVYFVDSPSVKIEPGLPNHMSAETLQSSGIARFEYNGKYWELKGASMWKRKGNGYGYYNTDNQLGG